MFGSLSSMSALPEVQLMGVTKYSSTVEAVSHTVTLPAHESGDLLIIALGERGQTVTVSGWTYRSVASPCGSQICHLVFSKIAASSSESCIVGFSGSAHMGAVAFVVRNADTVSCATNGNTVTDNAIFFPSHTAAAAAGKYLWLAAFAGRAGNSSETGTPASSFAGYSAWNVITTTLSTYPVFAGECHKISTNATEDPDGSNSTVISGYPLYPAASTIVAFKAA